MSGDDETRLPAGLPGAGPRQAMSLPHNVHPEQMAAAEHSGARWKRFQPLKKLQRMFRRKSKTKDEDGFSETPKSFSASQLLPAERARSSSRDSPPLQSRLSMSHDSIFQSECGPQPAEMGSALSIPSVPGASSQLAAELRGVLLKRRGDDSDDDPGLPHSPSSPSTPPAAVRLQKELKGQSGKSGGSCSDGSLLSMYSSGTCTDDDIFGPLSKHPSKASLGRDQDGLELETTAALSHSAAKHRISVRPRRNHGAPRQRLSRARPQTCPTAAGLPPTVEEESPPPTPVAKPPAPAAGGNSSSPRLYADRPRRTPSASPSRSHSIRTSSPDGATAAVVAVRPPLVKRSKSSVADRRIRDVSPRKLWSRDPPAPSPADAEDRRTEKGETFFSRIFGSRRSGRKKKDGRSLSPETADEVAPAAARRPPVPRHRSQHGAEHRSPASALHADIIRPPPSEATRAAEMPRPAEFSRSVMEFPLSAEPVRPAEPTRAAELSRQSDVPRPPAEAMRRGPAFLADVRAEVAALAAGGDRGDDSVTVSPQVLRRQRTAAAAGAARSAGVTDSQRARPRLVGLTAYQQRVTHLQESPSPETETKRRSFSCENISEEGTRRQSCSGMALGSVLSLIKSTAACDRQELAPATIEKRQEEEEEKEGEEEEEESGMTVPLRVAGRCETVGSPHIGPKSLDSSLLSAAAEQPPQPPPKASSAESVQSDPPERAARRSPDRELPEFMKVQLHRVEGRQLVSEPAAALARDMAAPAASPLHSTAKPAAAPVPLYTPSCESRASAVERRDSNDREATDSPDADAESPPQLRRPVTTSRGVSPELLRRPSQVRSRATADSEPVVLRAKPAPASEDSELLKVFKRRSLRSRDSEECPAPSAAPDVDAVGDTDEKENEKPREETEETVVRVAVAAQRASPQREAPAQRTSGEHRASPPRRIESTRPPPARQVSEDGEARRVSVTRRDSESCRLSGTEEDASRPPGWLKQAVRERREQREQREQKQLRTASQKELILESEPALSNRTSASSRGSRVLEMANTFQKLQIT